MQKCVRPVPQEAGKFDAVEAQRRRPSNRWGSRAIGGSHDAEQSDAPVPYRGTRCDSQRCGAGATNRALIYSEARARVLPKRSRLTRDRGP